MQREGRLVSVKQLRHAKIRQLLQGAPIDTHENLAEALRRESIQVSQSTLSKDLRELGVVRVPRPGGGFSYTLQETGATSRDRHILERELQDYLVSVDRAGNLLVVKTISAHAQSVCEAIDRIGWPQVMGTIAGDNTIFLVASTAAAAEELVGLLAEITGDSV
jgi:transcriptional regulator of arginine metabolism